MKKILIATCVALLAASSQAASPATPAKPVTAAAPTAPQVASPAEETSALFFSTCTTSMDNEKDFAKKMQGFVDSKTAVKMSPDKLTGMVSADESKNAWAFKGFNDPSKPLLMAYNVPQNSCGMHVSDIDPQLMRHAFQADLKKLVDATKATVTSHTHETKGDITYYSIVLTLDKKVMQLGLAESKDGKEFVTVHL